jgi:hypothetical protein
MMLFDPEEIPGYGELRSRISDEVICGRGGRAINVEEVRRG